jgi:hypothetical protein
VIPELLLAAALAQDAEPAPDPPAEPAPAEPDVDVDDDADEDDDLERYRTPFAVLADRTIGTTSTPVEFNWRRTTAQVAASGAFLLELNNFDSARFGGVVRLPTNGVLFEVGGSWTQVWDTPSSSLLALTPYRQPGRPPRAELDLGVGVPLAEGVLTAVPRWFPAVQLVFTAYGGLRYSVYPTGFRGLRSGEVASALFSPTLSQQELDNLEGARLDAMTVDPGRYGLLAGFGNELYFKRGFFVSPRVVLSVPLLAPVSRTDLLLWADLSVAVGMAF